MSDKTISNPMLVGALELMHAENTPEHRTMVMEEVLHAKFLSPVLMDPPQEPGKKGSTKIPEGVKMQVPMITSKDGKHFFMAYTDIKELSKWSKGGTHPIVTLTFNDYVVMIQNALHVCDGLVINPLGKSMVIPTEMVNEVMGPNA